MEVVKTDNDILTLLNQTHSPLLRLPAELRNTIYTLVIGHHDILVRKGFRGLIFQARRTSSRTNWPQGGTTSLPLTALPCTCRQLRRETSALPFALNTFVGEPENLSALLRRCPAATRIRSVKVGFPSAAKCLHAPSALDVKLALDAKFYAFVVTLRGLQRLQRVHVQWPCGGFAGHSRAELLGEVERVFCEGGGGRGVLFSASG